MKIRCYNCGQLYEKLNHKRYKAILNYIEKNPNVTQRQIISAMVNENVSSPMTTIGILDELVKENKISDNRMGNKFHKYSIKTRDK